MLIGDRVEIGSSTTIDRGAIENTQIGHGVKIDNQVQIAHNVVIGDNTAIAAGAAIAGSARIGASCTISGCVGIAGHITITDHVHITAMSMVSKSIPEAGSYSSGMGWNQRLSGVVLSHALDELIIWRSKLQHWNRKLISFQKRLMFNDGRK